MRLRKGVPVPAVRSGRVVLERTPSRAMKTYRVASPVLTHTRPATCEEVGCPQWMNGWDTIVPRGSDHEALLREVARGHSPDGVRRWPDGGGPCQRHEECAGGPTSTWHYPPGTACFKASAHRVSLDRPEIYTVRAGDWRQDYGLIRRHVGRRAGEHWVEDSQENFDAVRRQIGAG